ncbi:MAG: hypothetical protein ACPGUD_02370 [Parashewanella sp.]
MATPHIEFQSINWDSTHGYVYREASDEQKIILSGEQQQVRLKVHYLNASKKSERVGEEDRRDIIFDIKKTSLCDVDNNPLLKFTVSTVNGVEPCCNSWRYHKLENAISNFFNFSDASLVEHGYRQQEHYVARLAESKKLNHKFDLEVSYNATTSTFIPSRTNSVNLNRFYCRLQQHPQSLLVVRVRTTQRIQGQRGYRYIAYKVTPTGEGDNKHFSLHNPTRYTDNNHDFGGVDETGFIADIINRYDPAKAKATAAATRARFARTEHTSGYGALDRK